MIAKFYFYSLQNSLTASVTMATSAKYPVKTGMMILLLKHKNKVN